MIVAHLMGNACNWTFVAVGEPDSLLSVLLHATIPEATPWTTTYCTSYILGGVFLGLSFYAPDAQFYEFL